MKEKDTRKWLVTLYIYTQHYLATGKDYYYNMMTSTWDSCLYRGINRERLERVCKQALNSVMK